MNTNHKHLGWMKKMFFSRPTQHCVSTVTLMFPQPNKIKLWILLPHISKLYSTQQTHWTMHYLTLRTHMMTAKLYQIGYNWYCCIQLKYIAILINGYSQLIMWTVTVSLYMQNLQYVVTEWIILIFSKQFVHVTSTNANIQDCDEVVCKQ